MLNDAIRIRKGYEYDSEWVGEKIALYAKCTIYNNVLLNHKFSNIYRGLFIAPNMQCNIFI